jgi:hypothetical protein
MAAIASREERRAKDRCGAIEFIGESPGGITESSGAARRATPGMGSE